MTYFNAKCTKFNFGWGFTPQPTGEAYSPQTPYSLAGFQGPASKGNEEERREGKDKWEGREDEKQR